MSGSQTTGGGLCVALIHFSLYFEGINEPKRVLKREVICFVFYFEGFLKIPLREKINQNRTGYKGEGG